MDPAETIQAQFSTTLHLKADQLRQTRRVINTIAQYKYTSKDDEALAANIGLSSCIIHKIINDFYLINYLLPNKSDSGNSCEDLKYHQYIKLSTLSAGLFAKWLLGKSEFETIVLFFLYIENKSYEQIANEVIILNVDSVIQIQMQHIKNLADEIFDLVKKTSPVGP